jgi:hypothetical protein
MKRWALLVAALYALILGALTIPVLTVAFDNTSVRNVNEAFSVLKEKSELFSAWQYWLWLFVMFLCQAVLLTVPVRIAQERPVPRMSLLPTVLASGLMMGLLAAGVYFALWEFRYTVDGDWTARQWGWCGGLVVLTWIAWSAVFMRFGRKQAPTDWVTRQCRAMFNGSILELLVAVPTHVVARNRGQCCAGYLTFIGLATGISVMLFSFGPAVFFLFAARWKRLHPQGPS